MIDTKKPEPLVRCQFYARTPAGAGQFRYERINVDDPDHPGFLMTPYPPAPGDLIYLADRDGQTHGTYTVVARSWGHTAYGSADWPQLTARPRSGPWLDIAVEPAPGLFADEAPGTDADEEKLAA